MAKEIKKETSPIRETSAEAILLAKTLMRTARYGSLAVMEPQSRSPFVSRVAVATSGDGTPIILISSLSTHTQALLADPHCSLLLGEPGKGDPLAHPRVTLQCEANFLQRGSDTEQRARERYLRRNPKGKLYADFGDFSFVKLSPKSASLNGGFGQAFRLSATDLLIGGTLSAQIEQAETEILEHMNTDHHDAVHAIGTCFGAKSVRKWIMSGVDADGADLTGGDVTARAWFKTPATSTAEMRSCLIELTKRARS